MIITIALLTLCFVLLLSNPVYKNVLLGENSKSQSRGFCHRYLKESYRNMFKPRFSALISTHLSSCYATAEKIPPVTRSGTLLTANTFWGFLHQGDCIVQGAHVRDPLMWQGWARIPRKMRNYVNLFLYKPNTLVFLYSKYPVLDYPGTFSWLIMINYYLEKLLVTFILVTSWVFFSPSS